MCIIGKSIAARRGQWQTALENTWNFKWFQGGWHHRCYRWCTVIAALMRSDKVIRALYWILLASLIAFTSSCQFELLLNDPKLLMASEP